MRVLQAAGCLPNVFNSISNWEGSAFLDLLMEVFTFYVIKNDILEVIDGPMVAEITASWNKSGITNGKLGVCAQKCSVGFDVFNAQFE